MCLCYFISPVSQYTVLILCNYIVTVLCSSRLAMFYYVVHLNQSASKMPTFSLQSSWFLTADLIRSKLITCTGCRTLPCGHDVSFHLYDLPLCHMNSNSNQSVLLNISGSCPERAFPFPCFAHLERPPCFSQQSVFHLSFMTHSDCIFFTFFFIKLFLMYLPSFSLIAYP